MSSMRRSNLGSELTNEKYYLFAGSWAGSHGNASGLQSFEYDVVKSELTRIGIFGDFKSMSCVVVDGDLLISCVESKKDDLLVSFKIGAGGILQQVDTLHVEGLSIADLCIDSVHKLVFTSNFASGSVSMVSYDADGRLTLDDIYKISEPGSYITGYSLLERQNASHPHCTRMMPDGKHICVCDMGNDKLYILKINFENKKMILCSEKTVTIGSGEGPRHIVFNADGKFAYMNTEMGCTVYVFAVGEDASLTWVQKISTLDSEKDNPPKGWCSVIVLSADGKYAYVGNRGQNNIVGYDIGTDGRLATIGYFDCHGVSPRGLSFGYNDNVMFCSCNTSGTISVVEFDKSSGKLSGCKQVIEEIPGSANVVWGIFEG